MDVFPKFIIEGDNLIIAKCTFHKQLVTIETDVKGGGWFRFDKQHHAFILGGESHDFGAAKMEDIRRCIQLGNVWNNRKCTRDFSAHKFLYDTQSEFIPLN